MNVNQLSKRLETVARYVPQNTVLADIGSDHAYLPCALVKTGKIQKAIAGEVVKGPFESAVRNVKKEELTESITVRLKDGLFAIEETDEVDTVTIAGMGGPLIRDILESGKERLRGVSRLILQPNVQAIAIREWAVMEGWKLVAEEILKEDHKIYEVLVLERGKESYTPLELLLGPFLLKEKSAVFIEKWSREVEQWKRIVRELEHAEQTSHIQKKRDELLGRISEIEEVLKQ